MLSRPGALRHAPRTGTPSGNIRPAFFYPPPPLAPAHPAPGQIAHADPKRPLPLQGDALTPEQYAAVEELGLLVDRDDQGVLLQIFTKPVGDRCDDA